MSTRGYYRHPTIHRDTVVFVCEDDLWAVAAGGGSARRLTASPGVVTFPRFSPDGARLAYTGTAEGPTEVYVMDAGGGAGRRLTWLGANTRTVGWTPDGSGILFQSNAARPFARDQHLHSVPATGGPTDASAVGDGARDRVRARRAAASSLGRNSADPARWKRYRGGTAGTLWIDRKGDGRFAPLAPASGNIASPMWIAGRIWFLSDHEGHGNLYSCTPAGRDLRRHTDHEDFYARYPSSDGRRIVYHAGADLHLYDVGTGKGGPIDVTFASARPGRRRRFVEAAEHLETADLHPAGSSLAAVARGAAFTFGLWEGAPLRHGEPGARTRLARFLADGERVAAVTDAGGEESLMVFRADGTGRSKTISGDFGRVLDLVPAPAPSSSAVVAFSNHRQEVWIANLQSGDDAPDRDQQARTHRRDRLVARRTLARLRFLLDAALLLDSPLRSRPAARFTRSRGPSSSTTRRRSIPRGSTSTSCRCAASIRSPTTSTSISGFRAAWCPAWCRSRRETPSPFDAAMRAPHRPRAKPSRPEDPANGAETPTVKVDLEGIADRVVAFPMPEGRYLQIVGGRGRVFVTSAPIEGTLDQDWRAKGPPKALARVEIWDFERDHADTLLSGVTEIALSLDAHTLLVRAGNRLRALPAGIEARDMRAQGRARPRVGLDRPRPAASRSGARARVAPDAARGVAAPARPVLDRGPLARRVDRRARALPAAGRARRHALRVLRPDLGAPGRARHLALLRAGR